MRCRTVQGRAMQEQANAGEGQCKCVSGGPFPQCSGIFKIAGHVRMVGSEKGSVCRVHVQRRRGAGKQRCVAAERGAYVQGQMEVFDKCHP